MLKIRIILAATLIVALCACNSTKKVITADTADRLVDATSSNSLSHSSAMAALNGEWDIVNANGIEVTPTVGEDADSYPTITFELRPDGAGNVYCNTGCNYLNGDAVFSARDGSITFPQMLSTMMACENMETEQAIATALGSARSLRIEHIDGTYFLYLRGASGATLLTARRWDNNRLEGAWRVTAISGVEIPQEESREVQMVIDVTSERIHCNTGCNIINGSMRLLADRPGGVEITRLASTRMACQEPLASIERALSVALEDVYTARISKDGETAILLNEQGTPVISLRRLVLAH